MIKITDLVKVYRTEEVETTALNKLSLEVKQGEFVFCTISEFSMVLAEISPIGIFHEDEGTTLIISRLHANDADLKYDSVYKMITLTIHSDLNAIGFIAKITDRFAKKNIAVNVISAFHHDHLFVLEKDLEDALWELRILATE